MHINWSKVRFSCDDRRSSHLLDVGSGSFRPPARPQSVFNAACSEAFFLFIFMGQGSESVPKYKPVLSLSRSISLFWAFCGITCAVLRFLQPRVLHRIRVYFNVTPETVFFQKVEGTPSSAPPQVPDNRPLSRESPVEGNPILCLRCPALEVLPQRQLEII